MQQVIESRELPSGEPLMAGITGYEVPDGIMDNLVPFFVPVVDGSSPGSSLHGINFVGAVFGCYTLFYIESLRSKRSGIFTVFLWPAVAGTVSQLIPFGVTMPLYLWVLLLISPSSSERLGWKASGSLMAQLKAIPVGLVIGLILPSAALALPENVAWLPFSRQARIAFWQPFPVWMGVVSFVASKVIAVFSPAMPSDMAQQRRALRTCLRYLYAAGFAVASTTHIASWAISLTALWFPTIFTPEAAASLSPANVFWAPLPWLPLKSESLGMGAHWLLQWDQLVGTVAVLLWSVILHRATRSPRGLACNTCSMAMKTLALCLLTGVAGAAVETMWEREELLFQAEDTQVHDTKKKA